MKSETAKAFTEGLKGEMLPGFPSPNCIGCEFLFHNIVDETQVRGCVNEEESKKPRSGTEHCSSKIEISPTEGY